jgi:hypothetical protein
MPDDPEQDRPAGSESPSAPDAGGEIVCRTTRWYFNRLGLMFLLVAGFCGAFLFDGLVRYPKQIAVYQEYRSFKDREEAYDRFMAAGQSAEWASYAAERGWPPGEPPRWAAYALEKNLDAEPPERTPKHITEQFVFAAITAAIALAILATYLLNRKNVLRADANSFTTPSGHRVPFDSVFRIDKRKWKYKGLAYVHYRPEDGGPARRAAIDDLKFGGAGAVLDRLLGQFEGELIDRIEPGDEAPGNPAQEASDPAGKS